MKAVPNKLDLGPPSAGEIAEAKRFPNAHVFRIAGRFLPHEAVPPEAIIGAWKVNREGQIVGEFVHNPKYNAERWPAR
jgi:hypothetical protein